MRTGQDISNKTPDDINKLTSFITPETVKGHGVIKGISRATQILTSKLNRVYDYLTKALSKPFTQTKVQWKNNQVVTEQLKEFTDQIEDIFNEIIFNISRTENRNKAEDQIKTFKICQQKLKTISKLITENSNKFNSANQEILSKINQRIKEMQKGNEQAKSDLDSSLKGFIEPKKDVHLKIHQGVKGFFQTKKKVQTNAEIALGEINGHIQDLYKLKAENIKTIKQAEAAENEYNRILKELENLYSTLKSHDKNHSYLREIGDTKSRFENQWVSHANRLQILAIKLDFNVQTQLGKIGNEVQEVEDMILQAADFKDFIQIRAKLNILQERLKTLSLTFPFKETKIQAVIQKSLNEAFKNLNTKGKLNATDTQIYKDLTELGQGIKSKLLEMHTFDGEDRVMAARECVELLKSLIDVAETTLADHALPKESNENLGIYFNKNDFEELNKELYSLLESAEVELENSNLILRIQDNAHEIMEKVKKINEKINEIQGPQDYFAIKKEIEVYTKKLSGLVGFLKQTGFFEKSQSFFDESARLQASYDSLLNDVKNNLETKSIEAMKPYRTHDLSTKIASIKTEITNLTEKTSIDNQIIFFKLQGLKTEIKEGIEKNWLEADASRKFNKEIFDLECDFEINTGHSDKKFAGDIQKFENKKQMLMKELNEIDIENIYALETLEGIRGSAKVLKKNINSFIDNNPMSNQVKQKLEQLKDTISTIDRNADYKITQARDLELLQFREFDVEHESMYQLFSLSEKEKKLITSRCVWENDVLVRSNSGKSPQPAFSLTLVNDWRNVERDADQGNPVTIDVPRDLPNITLGLFCAAKISKSLYSVLHRRTYQGFRPLSQEGTKTSVQDLEPGTELKLLTPFYEYEKTIKYFLIDKQEEKLLLQFLETVAICNGLKEKNIDSKESDSEPLPVFSIESYNELSKTINRLNESYEKLMNDKTIELDDFNKQIINNIKACIDIFNEMKPAINTTKSSRKKVL